MRVVVIGSGNVAEAFAVAIDESSLELVQVYGRNEERVREICRLVRCDERVGESGELKSADIYIIAVSDGAVSELSRELNFADGSIVVHTAASVDISQINTRAGINRGVLYPLQTFTKGRRVSFREVPLFIEAEDESTYLEIESVAVELSDRVRPLSSKQRLELHLAAVYCCNFSMAMMCATSDILNRCGLPLDLYEPLLRETMAKAFARQDRIRGALTGPAVRDDRQTMERHCGMLGREPQLEESDLLIDMYKIISKYIWETSKKI